MFLNNHDPGDLSKPALVLMQVLARLSGSQYHEPSARDARRRIVDCALIPRIKTDHES